MAGVWAGCAKRTLLLFAGGCRWVMCAVHQRPQQKAARSCKHTKKRTLDTGHCVLPVNHQKVRKKKATEMGKRNYRRAGLAGSNGPEKCSLKRKYGEKVRQSGESIP